MSTSMTAIEKATKFLEALRSRGAVVSLTQRAPKAERKLKSRVFTGADIAELCTMHVLRNRVRISITLSSSANLDDIAMLCVYSYASGLSHVIESLGLGSIGLALAGSIGFALNRLGIDSNSTGLFIALLMLCGGIATLAETFIRSFVGRRRLERAREVWQVFQRAAALDSRARLFLEALRSIIQCRLDFTCTELKVRDLGAFTLHRARSTSPRSARIVKIEIIPAQIVSAGSTLHL